LFATLVRWIDRDIERNITNQVVALIIAVGVVPGALAGWNWFTVAIAVVWGIAWAGLWLWRMAAWLEREKVKKRRRAARKALRDRKRASSAEPQTRD
jgi:hypothetical protein